MNLKGEMSMLNVLHLEHTDVDAITAELQKKRDEMPQFFMQSPVVVDCNILGENVTDFDFLTLKESLLKLGFIPVGVRNIPASMNASLAKAGWAVMRESRKAYVEDNTKESSSEVNNESNKDHNTEKNNDITIKDVTNDPEQNLVEDQGLQQAVQAPRGAAMIKSLTVVKPVRSGQQIYAAESDMTVLAQTSAGSEIMADGSIHVYGALRGRVLAGAMGNESARIFCQSLQAELIAIAGRYQLLDESDTKLIGKPAMIKLSGEKLIIEPLMS